MTLNVGPDDGAGLYKDDLEPCLVCGRYIALDWDGVLCWHYAPDSVDRRILNVWCPASRTSWTVPDAA